MEYKIYVGAHKVESTHRNHNIGKRRTKREFLANILNIYNAINRPLAGISEM